MPQTTLQLRIDVKTKKAAKKTVEDLGFDLSSAVKLFLRNVIITGSIPLDLKTENGFTLEKEKRLLQEAKRAIGHSKRYKSATELHNAILADI